MSILNRRAKVKARAVAGAMVKGKSKRRHELPMEPRADDVPRARVAAKGGK